MLATQLDLQSTKSRLQHHQDKESHKLAEDMRSEHGQPMALPKLIEKSVIIHKDENGFGLRIKGQTPVYIEHVHEGGAAWRAGVRAFDSICKVNGVPVNQMDHKDVVLMFKSCSRFVALTLISPEHLLISGSSQQNLTEQVDLISSLISSHHRQYSIYSHHPNEDRRLASANDTTSLFAPNDYAIDTSSSLLMDRTRSCRSSGGLHMHQRASNILATSTLSEIVDNSHPHPKLNRRDSSEDKAAPTADKRIAICSCCQQQQCSRNSAADLAHKHLIQRQLNKSLRQPLTPTQSCDTAKLDQQRQQTLEAQTAATQVHDKNDKSKRIPQSVSNQELQASKGHDKRQTIKVGQQPASGPTPKPIINKRIEIIREFIDTERTHTERLRCLDELFYRPMKQSGFITGEQLRAVFACHRTLYKIHRQIYRILLSANFDIYSEPLVGSALLEIFEGDLKKRLERAACSFCSAQATNVELLNKLTRRDTKVGEFLAQVTSQRMIGRLGIKDLLASCFQRLTKYPLLLENLLKTTPQISANEDNDYDHQFKKTHLLMISADRRSNKLGYKTNSDHQSALDDDETSNNEHEAEADDDDEQTDCDDDDEAEARRNAAEEARRNSRRMLAISLAEEREFIERALVQSRQILVRVNEAIRVAMSRNRLKEIWKRTDKYPGVPLIDITKQQVVHEGLLTLRLSKRSFDVYVLLLNDYIIILTREGQDKYRLKFFTPEGKSGVGSGSGITSISQAQSASAASSAQSNLMPHQTVYSPVFVIDEHLTTRDAATDENGFYLLCKRKDDSRIYEFASRSPAERMKWRDKIQWTIEHQMNRNNRRPSNCGSSLTKSSSETSANGLAGPDTGGVAQIGKPSNTNNDLDSSAAASDDPGALKTRPDEPLTPAHHSRSSSRTGCEPTKIVGTISYVIDDGIVMPNKMESSRVFVDQAIQVNILDGSKVSAARGQEGESNSSATKSTTQTDIEQ